MKKLSLLLFITLLSVKYSFAQLTLPYVFENNSRYSDDQVYIGLVGKTNELGDVWMNIANSQLQEMSADDNTIPGPDFSYPQEWLYPDIFTKLSDLSNKTIQIPQGLYACRIFISFESPMYLHFHETGGYAGANLNNPGDPNDGIRWEIVELTWGDSGLWTNTSRVDAYQYPMGLEVTGFSGGVTSATYEDSYNDAVNGSGTPQFKRIGEVLPHQEILDAWDNTVSDAYKVAKVIKDNSIDGEPIIEQPSKVAEFSDDVLDDYIDEIWETYKNYDLNINIGDRGTWIGRVQANNTFLFTDPADGSIATIHGKPTTINAMEGSGFLAYTPYLASEDIEKYNEDLMIQAQMAAAITRHAIYTNIIDASVQYTHDADRFFVYEPYNEYVKFFHNEVISFESQTYAFAYDDVGDHSSTIQTTFPTEVKVIIGGYGETPSNTTFPDPTKRYYIDSPIHNVRIAASGESEETYTTSTNTTGDDVAWQFVAQGNGYWHIQRAAGGSLPRLRTDNSQFADMQGTGWSGSYTYYEFTEGFTKGTYFITLPDGPSNYKRLQVNNLGEVKMVSTASNRTWESFTFTEVEESLIDKSLFIEAESYTSMSGVQTEECDDDDTLNVGWIDTNDWMEYIVNIPSAGNYTLNLRVASPNNGASVESQMNGNVVTTTAIPNTGNWQSWETVSTIVNLSAGTQTLRLYSVGNGFNINWIEINNETASKASISKIAIGEQKLFPNPVNETLNLYLDDNSSISKIEIIDVTGKKHISKIISEKQTQIDMKSIASGFYFIRLFDGSNLVEVKKLLRK